MFPYKNLKSGLVALFLFLILTILVILTFLITVFPSLITQVRFAVLVLFATPIIFAWLTWNRIWGISTAVLATLLATIVAAQARDGYLNFPIFLYWTLAGVMNHFRNLGIAEERVERTRLEELEEEINILRDHYRHDDLLTDALKRRHQRYSQLKEVTATLNSSVSLAEVSEFITEQAYNLIGKSDVCLLFLVDENKQELALESLTKKEPTLRIKSKKGDLFDNWVLKQRQPLLVEDADKDFRFTHEGQDVKSRPFKSLIAVPLLRERKVGGILRLDSSQAEVYTPDDLRFLSIIGNLASVSIGNALLYQKTQELAIRDSLTSLYVYRYFHERLTEEIQRSVETDSPLSLLMMDLDGLKSYNDTYGHAAGDLALKWIAKILEETTKGLGITARYGGDEFAIILPREAKSKAAGLAEKIIEEVRTKPLILRKEKLYFTVSIGVVAFPEDGLLKEKLIKAADDTLLQAKRSGKNRVCVA